MLSDDRINSAKLSWAKIDSLFSDEESQLERFSRTTGIIHHKPIAVLTPLTQDELVAAVQIANLFSVPLYPVSAGKNFGYFAACPLKEDSAILDLSRMKRIIEVNQEMAYAVVEPGVTPLELYNYLQENSINLRMDPSGAPADSSLIGNICDRGHGFSRYSDHFSSSCAYEVILSDGTVIKTGVSAYGNSQLGNLWKSGIGPSLDGIFTQSNLGIISKATIWLLPKERNYTVVQIEILQERALGILVDKIRHLKLRGYFPEALHFYDRGRLKTSLSSSEKKDVPWSVGTILYGDSKCTRAAIELLKKSLRYEILCGDVRVSTYGSLTISLAEHLPFLTERISGLKFQDFKDALDLLRGKPSNAHLRMAFKEDPGGLSNRMPGLFWWAPMVPACKESVEKFLLLARSILHSRGIADNFSFIFLNERTLCAIVPIMFNRENAAASETALEIYRELIKSGIDEGFVPYRIAPEATDLVLTDPAVNEIQNRLKEILDPQRIIAPGRYQR